MNLSKVESISELGSSDKLERKFSIVPLSSPSTLDALTSWCYVNRMQDIYMEDVQNREQVKLVRPIYDEPQVNLDRLDSILSLQDTMI